MNIFLISRILPEFESQFIEKQVDDLLQCNLNDVTVHTVSSKSVMTPWMRAAEQYRDCLRHDDIAKYDVPWKCQAILSSICPATFYGNRKTEPLDKCHSILNDKQLDVKDKPEEIVEYEKCVTVSVKAKDRCVKHLTSQCRKASIRGYFDKSCNSHIKASWILILSSLL